jgi:hypothetical protein
MLTLCQNPSEMIAHSIILSALTGAALLSNSATALAMPAESSAKTLQARATSPINVQALCENYHNPEEIAAETTGSGCNDWVCRDTWDETGYGIDMNAWCATLHGPGAYASCKNGVYSWVCNH